MGWILYRTPFPSPFQTSDQVTMTVMPDTARETKGLQENRKRGGEMEGKRKEKTYSKQEEARVQRGEGSGHSVSRSNRMHRSNLVWIGKGEGKKEIPI